MICEFFWNKLIYLQDDFIFVVGLKEAYATAAGKRIKNFLSHAESTKSLTCSKTEKDFVLQYLVPANVKVTETPTGLKAMGSSEDVETCKCDILTK